MTFEEYKTLLAGLDEDKILDFCRKFHLHGEPFVFGNRSDDHYEFRKKIADNFNIMFHEIFITGSAKIGFSNMRGTAFNLESDIDVAIVSNKLWDDIMSTMYDYQTNLRENRLSVSERELKMYHKFLEYTAIGWIRPDQLPTSFQVDKLKHNWFDFFLSISYGKSEVGDYKVTAGIFKSYWHLEQYTLSGVISARRKFEVGGI